MKNILGEILFIAWSILAIYNYSVGDVEKATMSLVIVCLIMLGRIYKEVKNDNIQKK